MSSRLARFRVTCWFGCFCFLLSGLGEAQESKSVPPALARVQPLAPTEAISSFHHSSDVRIELIACEPFVMDPVAIDFDEFGKAYVVEMRGYSEQAESALGRVKLLRDENRDGRFDRADVFVDGLRSPTAVVCCFGGAIIADAPDLIWCRDDDGDGRADTRAILFSGFGKANIQQLLNNLQWGPDGRIHGSAGGNGGLVSRVCEYWPWDSEQKLPESPAVELRGRDFAIDLSDGSIRSTSGGGQFGMTFDNWGNRFVCSNSEHCQQIVLEESYLARNSLQRVGSLRKNIAVEGPAAEIYRLSPVEPWRMLRTEMRIQGRAPGPIEGGGRASGYFSGATGICFYDGDALPSIFRQCLYVGDAGSNIVHRKILRDTGLVKSAARAEVDREFLASTDIWFRPVQMANSPDGGLIVLDMYREVVEHPASLPEPIKKQLDLTSGQDRGRVYRLVAADWTYESRALPGDCLNDAQLIEMLTHPNLWHRRTAARLLFQKRNVATVDLLRKVALDKLANPATRCLALGLWKSSGSISADELTRLADDSDFNIRVLAARIGEQHDSPEARQLLFRLIGDADSRVRFQAVLSLGSIGADPDELARHLANVVANEDFDEFWQAAVLSAANGCRSELVQALIVRSESDNLHGGRVPILRELVRQMAQSESAIHRRELVSLLADHSRLGIEWTSEILRAALPAMNPSAKVEMDAALTKMSGTSLQRLQDSCVANALQVLSFADSTADERQGAVKNLVLASASNFLPIFREAMNARESSEMQLVALDVAAHFETSEIAEVTCLQIREYSPEVRAKAFSNLVSRKGWVDVLLDRIESGALRKVLLDPSTRQKLLGYPDLQVRDRANRLLGTASEQSRQQKVDQAIASTANTRGEGERGRKIFGEHCNKCHRFAGEGKEIGPDLTSFAYRGPADILTHLLDPNREVDPRYLNYSVQLHDGRLILGMIASESRNGISIRTAEGDSIELNRNEIDSLQSSTLSLMPENVADAIDAQGLADLLAYFESARK